ncbi:MAG TPA: hypothetical protein VKF41_06590 [Bryobacteraceae bacterium]|nr:hypothetical protein [Bryobacteraceae bacterium]
MHQRRFPWFTALSVLTTVAALFGTLPLAIGLHRANASLDPVDCYQRGLFCIPGIFDLILYFLGAIGLVLSSLWALGALFRREHWGGRIVLAGVALQAAPLIVYAAAAAGLGARRAQAVDRYLKGQVEQPGSWAIRDVLVQPDGKQVPSAPDWFASSPTASGTIRFTGTTQLPGEAAFPIPSADTGRRAPARRWPRTET